MKTFFLPIGAIVLLSTLANIEIVRAAGDESSAWSFQLTPYLWVSSLDGQVATIRDLPTVNVDASFNDIIDNLNFAFMLLGEARRDRFGLLMDLIYMDLDVDGTTPGPVFSGAELEFTNFTGTFLGTYRAFESDTAAIDVLGGVRVWATDTELTLKAGLRPAASDDESESWADLVFGARGQWALGNGFSITAYGDVGPFDTGSDMTWQLSGVLSYAFKETFSAELGYRILDVDYDKDGFLYDLRLEGPILGATFRF